MESHGQRRTDRAEQICRAFYEKNKATDPQNVGFTIARTILDIAEFAGLIPGAPKGLGGPINTTVALAVALECPDIARIYAEWCVKDCAPGHSNSLVDSNLVGTILGQLARDELRKAATSSPNGQQLDPSVWEW